MLLWPCCRRLEPATFEGEFLSTLPFTFEACTSAEELSALFSRYPTEAHTTILSRMVVCHNVSLHARNRELLKGIFSATFEYMAQCVGEGTDFELAGQFIQ